MTARCTRLAAALVCTLCASGCVTGHLFDAGRRWERAVAIDRASLEGDRLLLRYTAAVTTDVGRPIGRRARQAAIDVGKVVPDAGMESIHVEALRIGRPIQGAPVRIVSRAPASGDLKPALLVHDAAAGGPVRLELVRADGQATPLYANVLTRRSTAPWVYPLVPLAFAVDAAVVPVLVFFAPAVISIGD